MTKIEVTVWNGTREEFYEVATYDQAMKVIELRHNNAKQPGFMDIDTGNDLFDDGTGLLDCVSLVYVV